jgi:hypothetical protein
MDAHRRAVAAAAVAEASLGATMLQISEKPAGK